MLIFDQEGISLVQNCRISIAFPARLATIIENQILQYLEGPLGVVAFSIRNISCVCIFLKGCSYSKCNSCDGIPACAMKGGRKLDHGQF